jgi:hypothetical protein
LPRRVASLDDIDVAALEAWAKAEAPYANVSRELTKAKIWTRSKGRRHRDATAFMQNWLIKASDEAPSHDPPGGQHAPAEVPAGTASHRAINAALKRFDESKAMETHRAYQRDPAEAERLAETYLRDAA